MEETTRQRIDGMELNKKEKAWLKKLQRILDECPTSRIGFYTIGDRSVSLFDVSKLEEIGYEMDRGNAPDFGPAVDRVGAGFDEDIVFPNPVESTSG